MSPYRVHWITTCCACLLPASAVLAQWGGPAKVTVAAVELRDLPASMKLVGTVQPVTYSTLGAEIGGLVERMSVRQGDFVRAGDLICKLKGDTVSLQLAEARAKLKGLEATLGKWILEQQRIERLYAGQDASEKEVYETRASLDLARHEVARQQAVITGLKGELAKTEIRAPFSGFILDRKTEIGQWLPEGGDVVEVADLATVLVRVDVPEEALPYVHLGDRAWVRTDALRRSFEGTVRHVVLQADPAARTFPVEVAVPNPGYVEVNGERIPRSVARAESADGDSAEASSPDRPAAGHEAGPPPCPTTALLAGGMFARVTLQTGPPAKTLAVPKDAVVDRNGAEFVCLVMPGREEGSLMAMPTPITTGVDIGDWIAITSGNLPPGVRVVTKGNESIRFPSPVVIVEDLELPAPRSAASVSPPADTKAGS